MDFIGQMNAKLASMNSDFEGSELANFITVMLQNGKDRAHIHSELTDLISEEEATEFVGWLFDLIQSQSQEPMEPMEPIEDSSQESVEKFQPKPIVWDAPPTKRAKTTVNSKLDKPLDGPLRDLKKDLRSELPKRPSSLESRHPRQNDLRSGLEPKRPIQERMGSGINNGSGTNSGIFKREREIAPVQREVRIVSNATPKVDFSYLKGLVQQSMAPKSIVGLAKKRTLEQSQDPLPSMAAQISTQPSPIQVQHPVIQSPAPQITCRFGASCKRIDCQFAHPIGLAHRPQICKYLPNCLNKMCPFYHPEGTIPPPFTLTSTCRYDPMCTRVGCVFAHPSRNQKPHISDRGFAVAGEVERVVVGQSVTDIKVSP